MTLYQVDAFTNKLFSGNPAAVIPLTEWLDTELMQTIALENNLSETVYFVPSKSADADYEIRWFTPEIEINLCGHATLASAHVLFEILDFKKDVLRFSSKSGVLNVSKKEDLIIMDFPSWKPERFDDYSAETLSAILGGAEIVGVYKNRDYLVELLSEDAVKNCTPDFSLMKKHFDKMIITAPGKSVDFVSRFFAPAYGIPEDPVTGSSHTTLTPYWANRLGKNELTARQLSPRGGYLRCALKDSRAMISGQATMYMKGKLEVSNLL